jgi:hypothetical protein
MCFCHSNFGISWPQHFGVGIDPEGQSCCCHQNMPPSQDIKQLQHFLGMVNLYRCFLPNCAQVLRPLTDLLKEGAKNIGVDRQGTGGFPKCKMPPGSGGTTAAPFPQHRAFSHH